MKPSGANLKAASFVNDKIALMLILASTSPRRQELLRNAGIPFEVRTPKIHEVRRHDEGAEDYAIQGRASRWIPRIEGCYFNVVGLPVPLVYRMLEEHAPWMMDHK